MPWEPSCRLIHAHPTPDPAYSPDSTRIRVLLFEQDIPPLYPEKKSLIFMSIYSCVSYHITNVLDPVNLLQSFS